MSNENSAGATVYVEANEAVVCCRGASKSLGHPAVYLTFTEGSSVQCYYCGRVFKRTWADNQPETN